MTTREIRPQEDLSFVRQMNYLASFRNSGYNPAEVISYEQAQLEPGFKFWVDELGRPGDNGCIAINSEGDNLGAAWYRYHKRSMDDVLKHSISIGVAEHEQGKGVGTLLLNRLLEIAQNDGIDILELTVARSNVIAKGLYLKVGFSYTGVENEQVQYMAASTKK